MSDGQIEPLTAAGGIVFRYTPEQSEPLILMIFRNGVWDLPKGKLEPNETIPMCAAREIAEEVGSSLPSIVREIGTTYHEYEQGGTRYGKTTYWYSMIFTKPESFKPQKEEGIEKVEWFTLQKAMERAGFENLKEILRKFEP
ncbi:NUDIX hydrolase [Gracilimonas tropica]|uniref:NUDIX hydrolase n=1 Tax=Gracilimonas tropica TaxID=454600 RepID=UPI00037EF988|nr:NUDIX hydrolase [Gracilimonas tropica]